jgi:hypothetical protein
MKPILTLLILFLAGGAWQASKEGFTAEQMMDNPQIMIDAWTLEG